MSSTNNNSSSSSEPEVAALHRQIADLQAENERLRTEHSNLSKFVRKRQASVLERSVYDEKEFSESMKELDDASLTVVVIGASGHLARTKTFPALFKLYSTGLLPKHTHFVGFARSKLARDEFLGRLKFKHAGEDDVAEFKARCYYRPGQYDSTDDFKSLSEFCSSIEKHGDGSRANRIFYFAIPPSMFEFTAASVKDGALSSTGFNRIIVEKPFGKDSASSAALSKVLLRHFSEKQLYRIDHYLGKEMVQNLMFLRFANQVFEPLWNRHYINSIIITFKEHDGVEGRGGYFDEYGIIRDVMQNHLTQIMSLVAMEPPVSLDAEDIRDEKVKVLRAIPPIKMEDLVVGQYGPAEDGSHESYTQDKTVPDDSITPTFATAVMYVNNPRWRGVPFILKCGKGLNERKAEVRIQFNSFAGAAFDFEKHEIARNELVMRLQPDESIYLKVTTKSPGLSEKPEQTELNLTYKSRFKLSNLPDAYERLILDVARGDHHLFVRNDELEHAWAIYTPALHALEKAHQKPLTYPYGGRGPKESDDLIASKGYIRYANYKWHSMDVMSPPPC